MSDVRISKYGEGAVFAKKIFEADGVDFNTDATFAAGDVVVTKDNGTPANIATLPSFNGNNLMITLSATEMEAAEIAIDIVDQTATKVWLDDGMVVYTHGNASAKYNLDFDTVALDGLTAPGTATGLVRGQDTDSLQDVADAVTDNVLSEPTNLSDKTLGGLVYHLFSRFYHKVTQTATTQIVYKDDGTTALGTMAVSDDATTQTKGEASEN